MKSKGRSSTATRCRFIADLISERQSLLFSSAKRSLIICSIVEMRVNLTASRCTSRSDIPPWRFVVTNKKPIVCGGSVQYVSALLDGLEFHGHQPDRALRESIRREIDVRGIYESWKLIDTLDPEAASAIAPVDKRRIARFFELYRQTG